jgi:hypothetical protein
VVTDRIFFDVEGSVALTKDGLGVTIQN